MSPVSWGKSISRRLSTALMRLGSGLGLKTSTSEPVMNTNVEVITSDDDKSPVSRRVADWAKQKASSRRLALTKTSIIVHRHHFERCPPSGRLNATFKLGSLDGRSSALTAELDAQSPPGNSGRTSPLPVLVRVGTQPRDGRESPFLPARHSYNGWASDAEDNAMARGRPGSGDHALPMIGSSAPATPGSPGSSPGGGFVQRGPSLQRPRSPSQPGSLPTLPAGRALSRVQGESRLGKAASSRIHPSMSVPLPADGGS
ncbi:hypothetical protein HYH03_008514 [Edaphochlamys debaryana]|uniref:Uncharacterized protein n=1 Tax=Edaphochlamys debaryana TaxID=47281 RepID=A0A835XYF6_9CHLO|nr:hypothetical protein HYH03_008514 [Edaphochlamys debaryana]|eukprot:KAG2493382.1 hypothetical protein HYH03_008514 [Edaphochlamys debaryana]